MDSKTQLWAGRGQTTPMQQRTEPDEVLHGCNSVTPPPDDVLPCATDKEPANLRTTNKEEQEEEEEKEEEEEGQDNYEGPKDNMSSGDREAAEESEESEEEDTLCRSSAVRPAPPTSLPLSAPTKKKVLVAPPLSLSLGSMASDDIACGFLSPSLEDDTVLDLDLDAMDTPSDSESLAFPFFDPDLEDDLQRLGVATHRRQSIGCSPDCRTGSGSGSGSGPGTDRSGQGAVDREDVVDQKGTRWRCFSSGDPPEEIRVNMSVLQPFLRVLSHGGYNEDGMNDIIVFSSCYLPQSSMENYQYIMDHLFRFVVGTLDLMVSHNYVIVYLCAGGQKDKLPGIGWLRECYTTIAWRLRKNLKGFFVVHPTWYIKALITIVKPFISSKFSRKLQFIHSLQELSHLVPTEQVQIPQCVQEYDNSLSR